MEIRKKKKIFYKFLIFLLPLLIISIIVTSVILSAASHIYFRKTVQQDYRNILKSSTGEIRIFMESAKQSMQGLALGIASTKMDQWQKEMALTAFLQANPQFVSVSILSLDGKRKVSTDLTGKIDINHDSETFKKAISGRQAVSGVILIENDFPHTHVATPMIRLGKTSEILWGELNLKSAWDVLEGITIGRTGRIYIMDMSGRYLAHREIERVVKTSLFDKPDILESLRTSTTPVEWNDIRDGTMYICMGEYVSDLKWIVVLSQKRSEVYGYLYLNLYLAVFATCAVCLVAILLGWNWIKRLLAPVQMLHNQVKLIGDGNLEKKISLETEDEISDLGEAFNRMTDSLKEYISRELEHTKALYHAKNLASLGTASSKVTHEVSNFLGVVSMSLSKIKEETLSEKGKRALEIIERDSDHLSKFIVDFLQFARKPELNLSEIKIDNIINEVVEVLQPAALQKEIHIDLEWNQDIHAINVDYSLMYQVINNLVKNGIEATPKSGAVLIRGVKEDGHLIIAIEDTGHGMEPEVIEQIFDPFFTTKGKGKGTGLGMTIVKTIIEAHRGTIECASDINKGTTFVLRLPLE